MFTIDPKKLKVRRRTVRTSLGIGVCVLLFRLLGRGSPMLAGLAVVFATREDTGITFYFGIRRILTTFLAGIFAVLLTLIKQETGWIFFTDVFGVMIVSIIFITLCHFLDLSEAIIGGMSAFLIIYFNTSPNENIIYAIQRLVDTLIGTLVAVGVNSFFPSIEQ